MKISPEKRSAAIQDGVGLGRAHLVVDDNSLNLDPGVGAKRQRLGSDHEFRGYAKLPQNAYGGSGSLEALDLFEVQDAGAIDRCACASRRVGVELMSSNRLTANSPVEGRKIASEENVLKG